MDIVTEYEGFKNMLKKGFTLAEVLLTLTIIGVIAAITMPALMTNVNDNILEAQAKKFYSQLTAALDLYKARHEIDTLASGLDMVELAGTIMNTTIGDAANDLVESYTNVNRTNQLEQAGVFGVISGENQLYKLKDGSVFTIHETNSDNRPWIVAADVNGRRGPNRYGEDVWKMVIGTDGKIRIQGDNVNANNCLQGDTQGSCMAVFVQNNFRFRNYRDVIAQGSNNPSSSGSSVSGSSTTPTWSGGNINHENGDFSGGSLNGRGGRLPLP